MALGTWFLKHTHVEPLEKNARFVEGAPYNKNGINQTFYIEKDGSLMYNKSFGDYSVFLGEGWSFELIIDSATKRCAYFQSFLGGLSINVSPLQLPTFTKNSLYFQTDEELEASSGCHYVPFSNTVVLDQKQNLLCFGDCKAKGKGIEFAPNIIAVIDQEKLKCVYAILDDGIVDIILSHVH